MIDLEPPFCYTSSRKLSKGMGGGKMRYPIGDVARTLGVTHAGLHYFEKQGVIAPTKGDMARRT
ncbi:MAG: MerR family transcriptional regulator, partial [Clostridia bacterium]|nr:MerR family transcriptional regulator [Clostridia bacterium]